MSVEDRYILLIDIGSTYTKVTGIDLVNEQLLGSSKAHTTIQTNVCDGLNEAISNLEASLSNFPGWDKKLACSSAAGGLRMVAIGLVESLTSKAAKEASLSAGAKLLKTYSGELSPLEIKEMIGLDPDIILLSGGTDGGNKKVVISNLAKLGKEKVNVPIIYAGNKSATDMAGRIAEKYNLEVIITENVMPNLNELNIKSAKEAISNLFIEKIIEAKGISEAEKVIDNVLMPTPMACMKAAELLSIGVNEEVGIGDLLVIDIGGATTDVHSVCEGLAKESNVYIKGFTEPYVKRTVEGDLGARYSMLHTIEAAGAIYVCERLSINEEELKEIEELIEKKPDQVGAEDSILYQLDNLLSKFMVGESVRRHSGSLEEVYTPLGKCFEQSGKDLRSVQHIIGTGGPIIHHNDVKRLLSAATPGQNQTERLMPISGTYYLDHLYILSSMGLLSEINPSVALRIMKKNLIKYD